MSGKIAQFDDIEGLLTILKSIEKENAISDVSIHGDGCRYTDHIVYIEDGRDMNEPFTVDCSIKPNTRHCYFQTPYLALDRIELVDGLWKELLSRPEKQFGTTYLRQRNTQKCYIRSDVDLKSTYGIVVQRISYIRRLMSYLPSDRALIAQMHRGG